MCASISLWFIDLTSPVLQMQRKLYSKVRWISKTSAKWIQDEVLYNVGSVLSQGKLVLYSDGAKTVHKRRISKPKENFFLVSTKETMCDAEH